VLTLVQNPLPPNADVRAIRYAPPQWPRAALQAARRAAEAPGSVASNVSAGAEHVPITQEAADLKEFFEERAGVLQYDAGLPKPHPELEAARLVAADARNKRYSWLFHTQVNDLLRPGKGRILEYLVTH
jgi:hypothetical protein